MENQGAGQELKILVLKNSEWARGEREETRMLNPDGTRCCFGILAREVGVPDEALGEEVYYHDDVAFSKDVFPDYLYSILDARHGSNAGRHIADTINDNEMLSDEERVKALEPHFNKMGYTLDFRKDE